MIRFAVVGALYPQRTATVRQDPDCAHVIVVCGSLRLPAEEVSGEGASGLVRGMSSDLRWWGQWPTLLDGLTQAGLVVLIALELVVLIALEAVEKVLQSGFGVIWGDDFSDGLGEFVEEASDLLHRPQPVILGGQADPIVVIHLTSSRARAEPILPLIV